MWREVKRIRRRYEGIGRDDIDYHLAEYMWREAESVCHYNSFREAIILIPVSGLARVARLILGSPLHPYVHTSFLRRILAKICIKKRGERGYQENVFRGFLNKSAGSVVIVKSFP